ncbi:MAG: transcription-repair coupling factor [Deltaproteobacteria bacterium]
MEIKTMITDNGSGTYGISEAVRRVSAVKAGEALGLSGFYGSSKAYFLASCFKAAGRPMLVVLPTQEEAEGFCDDLRFFLGAQDVMLYPSTETLPFEPVSAHQELQASRMELLFNLTSGRSFITVSCASSLMQKVMPRSSLTQKVIELAKGGQSERDSLVTALHESGYRRVAMVEERGEVSVRGGIMDIFPPVYDSPLRIEFFDDEIESIRLFDTSTQRSIKDLDHARILPARESTVTRECRISARERLIERADHLGIPRSAWEPLSDRIRDGVNAPGMEALLPLFYDGLDTFFDYIVPDTLVAIIDPETVRAQLDNFTADINAAVEGLIARKQFYVEPDGLFLSLSEVDERLGTTSQVRLEAVKTAAFHVAVETNIDLRQEISLKKGERLLSPLAGRITGWVEEGKRVFLTAHNKGQAERTVELLEDYSLRPSIVHGSEVLNPGGGFGFSIATGALLSGFRIAEASLVVISEEEVFGEKAKRRPPPSRRLEAFLTQLQDLSEGDAIVHAHHGIGLYRGLKRLTIDSIEGDFLLLEYRDGDKLYLPVGRMDLVGKYHGLEGKSPELDKLGGPGWEKKTGKVKAAVEKLAGELLKLYAEREIAEGFAFTSPDRLFHEFEAGFEFDETPDQARAIEDTLKDMQLPRPMDRLVCGDVGYGKTEVAIRAAFKAVLDKKQVAVLVPTTVLAQQHFQTFSKRLSAYPVVVEALSRFRSPKEQKDIVKRLEAGQVDIIIGTHRLLQKDIGFKDLGLVVIDEEHRFGVAHKERLKQLRKKVDVLTLTATPIPRTLHMSLASVRELSIINTPPEDRLAIKSRVVSFDEGAIAEAIERELNRGGQVFFVHNRVQSIGAMEDCLRRIVPRARIAVGHGQMKEGELEKTMSTFINKECDILLSTSIIESGLDIPSANTIIINRADRFGLAELYQLRGRVGRSRHRAYAYFICPTVTELTDDARKRMEVIQELTEPGSGFRVATYDLEIRGAGELLGSSQSGQIAEVGFEMYSQLLEEAVQELRGTKVSEEPDPEITLRVSQFIPEDYIPDTRQRLGLYKRLASIDTEDDLDSLREELVDRYGEAPVLVENLLRTVELKLICNVLKVRELIQKGIRLYFGFSDLAGEKSGGDIVERALSMAKKEPKRFKIMPDARFAALISPEADPIEEARYVLKELLKGCYI